MSGYITKEVAAARRAEERDYVKSVVNIALGLFFLSGVSMFLINYVTGKRTKESPATLTRVLWKFTPEVNFRERRMDLVWNFRKLIVLGVVISSLFVSTFSLRMGVDDVLHYAFSFLLLWILAIYGFWYFYVEATLLKSRIEMDEYNNVKASEELQKKIDNATTEAWRAKVRTRDGGSSDDKRMPVTIVTGFLGAGKTTLIKNILQNTQGMRVLVIENEIGNESIDHELLLSQTKEEIIKMENGCVCCTVRKDLLVTFHRMFENESFAQLDWIVIETTGLADPAPLIQSLYMDAISASKLRLDGVLTLADAKHLPLHLKREKELGAEQKDTAGAHGGALEARLQLVFADRVLLNKIDLVNPEELDEVRRSVKEINPMADIFTCTRSVIDLDQILNIRAFDVNRNEELLKAQGKSGGDIQITRARTDEGSGVNVNPNPKKNFIKNMDSSGKIFMPSMKKSSLGLPSSARKHQGMLNSSNAKAREAANAIMETQRKRRELGISKLGRVKKGVSTISLTCEEPLELNAFNTWMANILRNKGEELYRVKGILWMHGYDEKFVAHGVHMLFDGERGEKWSDAPATDGSRRMTRLVFIGLNLDHAELTSSFYDTRHSVVAAKRETEDNSK